MVVMVRLIRAYQQVSRFTPSSCRFAPSCSEYAAQAITTHGAGHGSWLTVKRLIKCHPFHAGGYDPVPECVPSTRDKTTASASEESRRSC